MTFIDAARDLIQETSAEVQHDDTWLLCLDTPVHTIPDPQLCPA